VSLECVGDFFLAQNIPQTMYYTMYNEVANCNQQKLQRLTGKD